MQGDAYETALAKALKRLQTSDRFESEVRFALQGHDADVVERVVEELHRRRYLNDVRTAHHVVEANSGRRAVGDAVLRQRLERRGAPEEAVETALETSIPESERIDAVLSAKYRPTDDPAKAGRFLFSRGFSEDAIESALGRYFGDRGEE